MYPEEVVLHLRITNYDDSFTKNIASASKSQIHKYFISSATLNKKEKILPQGNVSDKMSNIILNPECIVSKSSSIKHYFYMADADRD